MKTLHKIIIFIIGVVFGTFIFPFLNNLKWDNTVSVSSIFTALVTLTVAYLISTIITKKNSERRIEKDIALEFVKSLIYKLRELEEYVAKLQRARSETIQMRNQAAKYFKGVAIELNQIDDCIKFYGLLSGVENPVVSFNEKMIEYRQALTLNTSDPVDFGACMAFHNDLKQKAYTMLQDINRSV